MLSIIGFVIGVVLLATGSEAFSNHRRLPSPTRGIWTQSVLQSASVRQMDLLRIKSGLRLSDAAVSDAGDDEASTKPSGIWNKVKSIVPPANERQKLIPLALMFFCILFSYTILRDTKDVLMITAPKSGAEVIPFIKTYVNLPVAIVRC
jgi:TLC ATP/ADP transporter